MSNTIIVSCECGSLAAEAELLKTESNTRVVCYCDDCQCYAHYLERPEQVLDTNSGTDIIQLSPAHFKIKKGKEHLGVLRLSPDGLLRWYTTCCNTPICNTPASLSMPYMGLFTRNLTKIKKQHKGDTRLATSTEDRILAAFGPVSFGVGAGNQHPIAADWPVAKGFGFKGLFVTVRNIGRWRLRGDHKRSELLDGETGAPITTPYILSQEERLTASQPIT